MMTSWHENAFCCVNVTGGFHERVSSEELYCILCRQLEQAVVHKVELLMTMGILTLMWDDGNVRCSLIEWNQATSATVLSHSSWSLP